MSDGRRSNDVWSCRCKPTPIVHDRDEAAYCTFCDTHAPSRTPEAVRLDALRAERENSAMSGKAIRTAYLDGQIDALESRPSDVPPVDAEVRELLSAFRDKLLRGYVIGAPREVPAEMLRRASLLARIGKILEAPTPEPRTETAPPETQEQRDQRLWEAGYSQRVNEEALGLTGRRRESAPSLARIEKDPNDFDVFEVAEVHALRNVAAMARQHITHNSGGSLAMLISALDALGAAPCAGPATGGEHDEPRAANQGPASTSEDHPQPQDLRRDSAPDAAEVTRAAGGGEDGSGREVSRLRVGERSGDEAVRGVSRALQEDDRHAVRGEDVERYSAETGVTTPSSCVVSDADRVRDWIADRNDLQVRDVDPETLIELLETVRAEEREACAQECDQSARECEEAELRQPRAIDAFEYASRVREARVCAIRIRARCTAKVQPTPGRDT